MSSVALFDTHAHVFTNDTARYPVDVTGARRGEAAILERIRNDPATAEKVLDLWNECGVAGGAIVQYNTVYKTDNSYTLDTADEHSDRMAAVLILRADELETPETLRALATRHNVSGLRAFGYPDDEGAYPWLDSPAALRTWEVAAERGLAGVVMYAPGVPSRAALRRVAALAKRFAPMTIALDHCGWPATDKGVEATFGPEHMELVGVANVVFKFTQINLNRFRETGIDAAVFVRRAVDTFGVDRIMWGSDFGNTLVPYADMVAQAIAATALLDESERARVLHDNGRRVFGPRAYGP